MPWVRTTDAPSPTVTSVSVVSGPISQRPPMRVAPSSWVPGWMTVSRPMVTSTSIQVVAGSTIVTPARWWAATMRRFSSAASSASWTRSLTPATSAASSTCLARTIWPSCRMIEMTSVR